MHLGKFVDSINIRAHCPEGGRDPDVKQGLFVAPHLACLRPSDVSFIAPLR